MRCENILNEITIKVDNRYEHLMFKPPYPFGEMNIKNKRILNDLNIFLQAVKAQKSFHSQLKAP